MKSNVQETVTYHIRSSCGSLFVAIGPKYFRCHFNKNGSCFHAMADAVNHFVKFLITNNHLEWEKEVAKILRNIRCVSPFYDEGEHYSSCFDAISKVLEKHLEMKKENENKQAV